MKKEAACAAPGLLFLPEIVDTVRDTTALDGILFALIAGKATLFRAGELRFEADGIFLSENFSCSLIQNSNT